MKTTQEIFEFIKTNKTIPAKSLTDVDYNRLPIQIDFLLSNLRKDEDVKFAMVTGTMYNGKQIISTIRLGILFITNYGIVYGKQDGLLSGGTIIKQINIDEILDISRIDYNIFVGRICISTRTEECIIEVNRSQTTHLFEMIRNAIHDIVDKKTPPSATTTTTIIQPISTADEIKKFKDLLDMGIITQEEFDAKKKQLLGL